MSREYEMMLANSAAAGKAPPPTSCCFVYGTLMSSDVLQVLLGRVPTIIPNAILQNHSRHPVRGRVYPGVIPTPINTSSLSSVEGKLLLDITPLEMKYLDWFENEGVDYNRIKVQVMIPNNTSNENGEHDNNSEEQTTKQQQTNAYIWSLGTSKLDTSCDWDYNMFVEKHLEWYIENVVMPCRIEIEEEFGLRR